MSQKNYDQYKRVQIELQYKSQREDSKIQTQAKNNNTECIFEQQITHQDRQGEHYKQIKSVGEDVSNIGLIDKNLGHRNVSPGQKQNPLAQAYDFHGISMRNRQNMVNWMLQVMRVLKVASLKTFMISVQIMDKYFIKNYGLSNKINKDDLHLVGMTSIIISSKFEDVSPIDIDELVVRAGHLKFTRRQIISKEVEMLRVLEFKIFMTCINDDAQSEFSSILQVHHFSALEQTYVQEIKELIDFLCVLLQYGAIDTHLGGQYFAKQLVQYAFDIVLLETFNKKIASNIIEGDKLLIREKDDIKVINKLFIILNQLASDKYTVDQSNEKEEGSLQDLLFHIYNDIAIGKINGKHLKKLYPNYFQAEMSLIIREIFYQKSSI
ncbi:UNKNOWN [Stylonychia lemnae]|uniref:Cyclin-like domain-containing protein n=1 Tax=Stylonychia lemnae TaxID=5949 RepID=A0A077ZUI9_STYLE|nr:UNKNOWN [Stylonychia lemnae]|eukprot:CDW73542.1 UNKNOWN [Stylonychia lemnae]